MSKILMKYKEISSKLLRNNLQSAPKIFIIERKKKLGKKCHSNRKTNLMKYCQTKWKKRKNYYNRTIVLLILII